MPRDIPVPQLVLQRNGCRRGALAGWSRGAARGPKQAPPRNTRRAASSRRSQISTDSMRRRATPAVSVDFRETRSGIVDGCSRSSTQRTAVPAAASMASVLAMVASRGKHSTSPPSFHALRTSPSALSWSSTVYEPTRASSKSLAAGPCVGLNSPESGTAGASVWFATRVSTLRRFLRTIYAMLNTLRRRERKRGFWDYLRRFLRTIDCD